MLVFIMKWKGKENEGKREEKSCTFVLNCKAIVSRARAEFSNTIVNELSKNLNLHNLTLMNYHTIQS